MKNPSKEPKDNKITINKEHTTKYTVNSISGIIFSIILIIFITILFIAFSKVEVETEGWCNSGYIGLDIEAYNNIQNKTCTKIEWDNKTEKFETIPDPKMKNLTCFKQDFQLKHVKLKDIDGLNCQGKAKIKMPFILSLLWGGMSE